MISIALHDLNDRARAELVYQQGVMKFEDVKSRELLARQMSGLQLRIKRGGSR